jgi:hypothetical protein
MSRSLGVLIPADALEDDEIYNFCRTYLDQGIFQELKVDKYQPPKNRKVRVKFTSLNNSTFVDDCKRLNITPIYANAAKAFWTMFYTRSSTKTLLDADLLEWVKTVRLISESDKRDLSRMYKHFQWMEKLEVGDKNRFWFETVDSISGIRKHWDKIEKQWYLSEPKKEIKPYAPGF